MLSALVLLDKYCSVWSVKHDDDTLKLFSNVDSNPMTNLKI